MINSIYKKHITLLILAIVILLASLFGLWKFENLMQTKIDRVITVKAQLASYEENKKIYSNESAIIKTLGERVSALDQYRITTKTTPELLSKLEELAIKNGVTFLITSAEALNSNKTGEKLTIGFTAKGSKEGINNFVDQLSHQTYQLKFTRFSLYSAVVPVPEKELDGTVKPVITKVPQWEVLSTIQITSFDI